MTMTASNQAAADKPLNLDAANRELDAADATQVVQWACDTFGDGLVMTSSFGAQSAVMLHLVTQVTPDIPVIFIDTGYLFPETYQFARNLTERLKLNLQVFSPRMTAARQEALYGKLWEQGEDGHVKYHQINKIEPMQRAIKELGVTAWLAGLRRQQTDHRASLPHVALQTGIYKVHPILTWSTRDVHEYLKAHDLPYHPLYEKGYPSIGDVHSTLPITAEQHERDGRFAGSGSQECGLHIPESEEEAASRDASGL